MPRRRVYSGHVAPLHRTPSSILFFQCHLTVVYFTTKKHSKDIKLTTTFSIHDPEDLDNLDNSKDAPTYLNVRNRKINKRGIFYTTVTLCNSTSVQEFTVHLKIACLKIFKNIPFINPTFKGYSTIAPTL